MLPVPTVIVTVANSFSVLNWFLSDPPWIAPPFLRTFLLRPVLSYLPSHLLFTAWACGAEAPHGSDRQTLQSWRPVRTTSHLSKQGPGATSTGGHHETFCYKLGRCPSTVRSVFPVLVFQLSKQQNHARTPSSTVLRNPPNRARTNKFPEQPGGRCFVGWVVNWESTENWDFHRLEPYTKPYSDTSW